MSQTNLRVFATKSAQKGARRLVVADMSAAPPEVALPALEEAITFEREVLKGLGDFKTPIVAINPDYPSTDIEALRLHGVKVAYLRSWTLPHDGPPRDL